MSRVLILTGDTLGVRLAGPAIRAIEIAKVLSAYHDVTLGCHKAEDGFSLTNIEVKTFGEEPSISFLKGFDTILAPGSMQFNPSVECPLIIDLYDPFILSNLSRFSPAKSGRIRFERELDNLLSNVMRGDFFICASERQWDFWMGILVSLGRVSPEAYRSDTSLRSLLDIVPFGIPEEAPHCVDKPVFPNYREGDAWLLWGGGIWNWFDPLTLIRAISEVPFENIKLLFMGTAHPDPRIPKMEMAVKAIELAEKLALKDRRIYFGDWTAYSERQYFLTQATAGVSTHFPHIETRFSFRTRILDYIWAGLPILCTEGDALSDIVSKNFIGITVPPENVKALSNAIERLVFDETFQSQCRQKLRQLARHFTWSKTVTPVVEFCKQPCFAADASLRRKFLSQHVLIPAGGCETRTEPIGELTGSTTISQIFQPPSPGLFRIDLMFGTYMRTNTGKVFVMLKEKRSGNLLLKQTIDMKHIQDNQWFSITFPSIDDSEKNVFILSVSVSASKPGNTITIWSDTGVSGNYFWNKEKRKGSLTFRYFCREISKPVVKNSLLAKIWGKIAIR